MLRKKGSSNQPLLEDHNLINGARDYDTTPRPLENYTPDGKWRFFRSLDKLDHYLSRHIH